MSSVLVIIVTLNILLAIIFSLGLVPVMVWIERRVAGFIQDRLGPNRCNIGGFRLGGLIQSFADMLKLVFKEDFSSKSIKERFIFKFAPAIVFSCAFLSFMVMPFADNLTIGAHSYIMQALPVDFGILWFLAFAGLGVYGIMLGGWSSNNKYSLLGAIRAGAQVISYEASMTLALISLLISYGSIHLVEIVNFQSGTFWGVIPAWGIFIQPLAALIFVITAFAEANRTPFDIAEGESEIVGGFHTEYSAMKFGLFFVGEYVAMSASSAFMVTLFLGGYNLPWVGTELLKSNMDIVMVAIIIILPLLSYKFKNWIFKNNTWPDVEDSRNRESIWLVRILAGLNIVIIVPLAYFLVVGLSPNAVSIAVMIIQIATFAIKLLLVNFFFVWVRWTLPRFRYDQLQNLGWKVLLPLSLANIFITATVVVVFGV
ncbi:complex I subunit 1/NuoH family protein [Sulfurospirillum sp. 1612]|uniref:complex I subunit 1/NuoH family protein n=1 Tax=Sulfurospirillum sp. 1612 TaxID=3094835 RepID=UPI002F930531